MSDDFFVGVWVSSCFVEDRDEVKDEFFLMGYGFGNGVYSNVGEGVEVVRVDV